MRKCREDRAPRELRQRLDAGDGRGGRKEVPRRLECREESRWIGERCRERDLGVARCRPPIVLRLPRRPYSRLSADRCGRATTLTI